MGCPIWDAHIFWAYRAVGDENKGNSLPRDILATLIPEEKVTTPHGSYRAAGKCKMFEAKEGAGYGLSTSGHA